MARSQRSAGSHKGPGIGNGSSRGKGGGRSVAKRQGKGAGGFASKAQWRMFFARGNKNPKWSGMAHKKAHKSRSFKTLPARKGGPTSRTVR